MHVEETVRLAEAIFRFTEEVDRRLAEHGIAGVDDLLRLYGQLRHALDRINARELEWASGEASRLARRLEDIGGELQHLSALKTAMEGAH